MNRFTCRHLDKDQEIRMILPSMYLLQHPTHARPIAPHDNEQVLAVEPHLCVLIDDLYVSEILAIRADFILAFHDQRAAIAQNAMSFAAATNVQIQHCGMPLVLAVARPFVSI